MPPKLPPTDEEKREGVRQEGRKGIIDIPMHQYHAIGRDRLLWVWNYIEFQIFKTWEENQGMSKLYYGYCPLFAPLKMDEDIPTYSLRVAFEKSEPLVELLQRRVK